jgi:alkylhydroperoxidase family enzyme
MHWKDAKANGETDERLYMVAAWREATVYTSRERAALALAEEVTLIADGGVPDDVWAQVEDEFDPEEIGQLLFAIAAINVWNRLNVSVQTEAGHYVPGMFG